MIEGRRLPIGRNKHGGGKTLKGSELLETSILGVDDGFDLVMFTISSIDGDLDR